MERTVARLAAHCVRTDVGWSAQLTKVQCLLIRGLEQLGDPEAAYRVAAAALAADAGDGYVAGRLGLLLEERGDLDGLRARAEAGDRNAAGRLAGLLSKQGRAEEAERLRRFGLNPDGSIACV